SDVKGFNAALWLRDNYSANTTVVVTEIPGSWFGVFSEKSVFAETDPIVERNVIAESVLELAYELEHPLLLVRTYESKGAISSETYIPVIGVWKRVAYSSGAGDFLSYKINSEKQLFELHSLHRETIFDVQSDPKKIIIHYFNEEVRLIQTLEFKNSSYPIAISWTICSELNELREVKLYLSTFLDLSFSFTEAYIPGVLDWQNPWDAPSNYQENTWAVSNFTATTLTGNLLALYNRTDEVLFALRFEQLPDWGNVGALSSRQIDAIRVQYEFDKIEINQEVSLNYDLLSFSRNNFPEMNELNELGALFDLELVTEYNIVPRDYHTYIKENNIEFIVYDKNQLDTKLVNSKLLKLIYSNDRYVIFKVRKII
ncbi:MAG: hypothetical protein R3250_16145, partial [Melioribacteraceae bacterium]|nr:hypothetical protein [Melioribacteraceae bacterium]